MQERRDSRRTKIVDGRVDSRIAKATESLKKDSIDAIKSPDSRFNQRKQQ